MVWGWASQVMHLAGLVPGRDGQSGRGHFPVGAVGLRRDGHGRGERQDEYGGHCGEYAGGSGEKLVSHVACPVPSSSDGLLIFDRPAYPVLCRLPGMAFGSPYPSFFVPRISLFVGVWGPFRVEGSRSRPRPRLVQQQGRRHHLSGMSATGNRKSRRPELGRRLFVGWANGYCPSPSGSCDGRETVSRAVIAVPGSLRQWGGIRSCSPSVRVAAQPLSRRNRT